MKLFTLFSFVFICTLQSSFVGAQTDVCQCIDSNGKKEFRNTGPMQGCELMRNAFDIESIGSAASKSKFALPNPNKRWTFLSYTRTGESVWFDQRSLKNSSASQQVWLAIESGSKLEIDDKVPASIINLYSINCMNHSLTLDLSEKHTNSFGSGPVIENDTVARIIKVRPESVLELLVLRVCK